MRARRLVLRTAHNSPLVRPDFVAPGAPKRDTYFCWSVLVVVLSIFNLPSLTQVVHAEHEADHRYTVWGYVKDGDGAPIQQALVVVTDSRGTRLKTTHAGANGRYTMQLHLHNNDLGRLLVVETGDVSHQIRVAFDPDNSTSLRKHRVDFLGSQALETLPSKSSFMPYMLLAIGAVVVLIPALRYITGRGKSPDRSASRRRGKSAKARARRRAPKRK